MSSKSANYCFASRLKNEGLLVLSEVNKFNDIAFFNIIILLYIDMIIYMTCGQRDFPYIQEF